MRRLGSTITGRGTMRRGSAGGRRLIRVGWSMGSISLQYCRGQSDWAEGSGWAVAQERQPKVLKLSGDLLTAGPWRRCPTTCKRAVKTLGKFDEDRIVSGHDLRGAVIKRQSRRAANPAEVNLRATCCGRFRGGGGAGQLCSQRRLPLGLKDRRQRQRHRRAMPDQFEARGTQSIGACTFLLHSFSGDPERRCRSGH